MPWPRHRRRRDRWTPSLPPYVRSPSCSPTAATYSRRRQAVIAATPELRERELIKMASLAAAFTEALRQRGVAPAVAPLAAETGVAVFRVAFERWIAGPDNAELADVMRETLTDLAGLTT
jgi:hypothetical protein